MPDGSPDLIADHSFAAPIERVVAMFASEDFACERGMTAGAFECDTVVDGDPSSAFSVIIRRTLSTEGIQPEFRPFIGSTITVRYSEAWEPPVTDRREGTFAIDIVGVPARAAGTLSLVGHAGFTDYSIRGAITVNVPFLGGLVQKAILDSVRSGLDEELAAADAWLAKA